MRTAETRCGRKGAQGRGTQAVPGETGIARIKCVKRWGTSAGKMVGVAGFEPATPSSRTRCATRLRYTPTFHLNGCFQRFEACWLRRCPFRWRSYSVLVACPQATSVAFIHCFMIAVACFRKGAQELLFSTSGERAEKQPSALDVMGRGEPRRALGGVGWCRAWRRVRRFSLVLPCRVSWTLRGLSGGLQRER